MGDISLKLNIIVGSVVLNDKVTLYPLYTMSCHGSDRNPAMAKKPLAL